MHLLAKFSEFKRDLLRDVKRVSKVGTWDSLSDAAVYVSSITLVITSLMDLLVYIFFCVFTDYPFFISLSTMDQVQFIFFFAIILHILLSTLILTIAIVNMYDRIISKPVKELIMKMRNIDKSEMTDYLLSGKLSRPFSSHDQEETWMDMVQGYVDTASAEKYLDELTGCFNRKYFSQILVNHMRMEIMANGTNVSNPLTYDSEIFGVFIIDIDYFKKVNDDFGHAYGDEVLRKVGSLLRAELGDSGVVIRNGGEEFLIVVSAKFPYDFGIVAEKINNAFRQQVSVVGPSGENRSITCSIGFVRYPLFRESPISLSLQNHVDLADQAMYHSKLSGRDTWHELVAIKNFDSGVDIAKFCGDSTFAIDNGYLSLRKAEGNS